MESTVDMPASSEEIDRALKVDRALHAATVRCGERDAMIGRPRVQFPTLRVVKRTDGRFSIGLDDSWFDVSADELRAFLRGVEQLLA